LHCDALEIGKNGRQVRADLLPGKINFLLPRQRIQHFGLDGVNQLCGFTDGGY
jgi:hypothetical protein